MSRRKDIRETGLWEERPEGGARKVSLSGTKNRFLKFPTGLKTIQ